MTRLLVWLLRAAVFFTLFAFALNNQHEALIHWFFGRQSHAPMVLIVLVAFALGCVFGVLAMVPSWWRGRRAAPPHSADMRADSTVAETSSGATPPDSVLPQPPRDGL